MSLLVERESERENHMLPMYIHVLYTCIYVYIYLYSCMDIDGDDIHVYTCMYVYPHHVYTIHIQVHLRYIVYIEYM